MVAAFGRRCSLPTLSRLHLAAAGEQPDRFPAARELEPAAPGDRSQRCQQGFPVQPACRDEERVRAGGLHGLSVGQPFAGRLELTWEFDGDLQQCRPSIEF